MRYYLIVLLAVVGLAVNFCLTKLYQDRTGTGFRISVLFNIITGAFTAVLFFFINGFMNGFSLHFTPFSWLMAFLLLLFCGGYALIGFKIIAMGDIAVYTLFLMLGGMMLPYFFGLIFLEEQFSYLRLAGLILMVIAIALSGREGGKGEKKKGSLVFFLLCMIVFCLNGGGSIVSKIHQLPENIDRAVLSPVFVMMAGIIRVVIFSLIYFGIRLHDKKLPADRRPAPINLPVSAILIMLASSAVDGASYLCQLAGASHLPATVLYPMITGGSVVLTAIAGRIFFGQKLTRQATIGIVLCLIATLLFL
jgi:drug/metabolite transporter (DMT)-like permease